MTASFQRLLGRFGLPLVLLVAVAASVRPGLEHDVWWHMASGRWMAEHGQWLREDVFSWTRFGDPWVRPGLVADVGMYAIHWLGGAPGLKLVTAALFAGTFALLWSRSSGSATWRTAVLVLCVLTAVVAAVARPLVVSLPLAALTAVVLDRERSGQTRWLWSLPVVAVIWVNVHGAFVVLYILIGCHLAARLLEAVRTAGRERSLALHAAARLGAVGFVGLVATLVNPFGWRMLPYPFETLGLTVLGDFVHEWRRPSVADPQFWPLFILIVVTIVTFALNRSRVRLDDVFIVLAFGGLALTAARHAAIFAVVVPPLLTRIGSPTIAESWLSAWRKASRLERRTEGVLLGVLALGVAVVVWPAMTPSGNDHATRELIDVDAADWVAEAELPGRLWNSYDQGGYIIWTAWPDVLVSIDSRTDLYGDDAVRDHVELWLATEGAAERLAQLDIGTVLVERTAPLIAALEADGWELAFEDHLAVVLTISG